MKNQNQFVYSVVTSEAIRQFEDDQKKELGRKLKKIYQLKVSLIGISRDTWRRVLIPNGLNFAEFHEVIQCLFEWKNIHYYEFEAKKQIITLEERNGLGTAKLVDRTLIDAYIEKNEKLKYTYDFHEEWVHEILIEDIFTRRDAKTLQYKKFPVCTEINQPAPLEETRKRIKYGRQTYTTINTKLRLLPCYQGLMQQ